MRKNKSFFVVGVAIALLTGCAKERDNYDKYLTSGTWTMTTVEEYGKEEYTYDYVAAGTPTKVETSEETATITAGQTTSVDLTKTAYVPGATTFTRKTKKGKLSLTFTFNKDGTYQLANTSQKLTEQTDTELGDGPVLNVAETERNNASSGLWFWQNTTETKQQINLNGQMFDVDITKNGLVLSLNITGSGSEPGTDGTGDYIKTSTYVQNIKYSLTK